MRLLRNGLLVLLVLVASAALVITLWPTPGALLVRHVFTGGGGSMARDLEQEVPDGVEVREDLPYGDGASQRLDVARPSGRDGALPVVVWLHGGSWVGGDKADVRPYLEIVAARGYAVVGVNYSLAPGRSYPTPVREVAAAVRHVVRDADELGVDPTRVVLAGDSAGAQLAAQVATLVTDPTYEREVGVRAPIDADALRGVVLHSPALDPGLMAEDLEGVGGFLMERAVRSYLGDERERNAAQARVVDHVTGTFPPTWLTSGNGDPLAPSAVELAERLGALDVDVTSRFYPADHEPRLGHEYQFDVDGRDGEAVLEQTVSFLDRVTG